jgi:hypothetical protein
MMAVVLCKWRCAIQSLGALIVACGVRVRPRRWCRPRLPRLPRRLHRLPRLPRRLHRLQPPRRLHLLPRLPHRLLHRLLRLRSETSVVYVNHASKGLPSPVGFWLCECVIDPVEMPGPWTPRCLELGGQRWLTETWCVCTAEACQIEAAAAADRSASSASNPVPQGNQIITKSSACAGVAGITSANLSCAVMDMCRHGVDRSRPQTFALMSV